MTDIDLDAILTEIESGKYDEDMLYRAVEALVGRIRDLEAEIENSVSLYWQRRAEKAEAELGQLKREYEFDVAIPMDEQREHIARLQAELDTLREAVQAGLDFHDAFYLVGENFGAIGDHFENLAREALAGGGEQRCTCPAGSYNPGNVHEDYCALTQEGE